MGAGISMKGKSVIVANMGRYKKACVNEQLGQIDPEEVRTPVLSEDYQVYTRKELKEIKHSKAKEMKQLVVEVDGCPYKDLRKKEKWLKDVKKNLKMAGKKLMELKGTEGEKRSLEEIKEELEKQTNKKIQQIDNNYKNALTKRESILIEEVKRFNDILDEATGENITAIDSTPVLAYFKELQAKFSDNSSYLDIISSSLNKLNNLTGHLSPQARTQRKSAMSISTTQAEKKADSKVKEMVEKAKTGVTSCSNELNKLKESIERRIDVCTNDVARKIEQIDDAKLNKDLLKQITKDQEKLKEN